MTTIAKKLDREASLPSMADQTFLVLGDVMDSVVRRQIAERLEFARNRCMFWEEIAERMFPQLGLLEDEWESPFRVDSVTPADVSLASQYQIVARRLDVKRLPTHND